MLKINNNTIGGIYLDNQWIEFAYSGDKLVYEQIFTRRLREGVIIFQDTKHNVKKAAKPSKLDKIDLERYTPIGVVVTPLNSERHLMMSLPVMITNDPTVGTTDKKGVFGNNNKPEMTWGPGVSISGIQNISKESDAWQSFDGEQNTKQLIKIRGSKDYNTWKPNDNNATGTYPAASCCDMFFTVGTEQKSWYLPACGELKYIVDNYATIESTLNNLASRDVFACPIEDDSYWSSNDGGTLFAWRVKVQTATISREYKASDRYFVRAFHVVNLEEFEKEKPLFNANGYDYVDMGEAGIWSMYNTGSIDVSDPGLFYQWGDVNGYSVEQIQNGEKYFWWSDYCFSESGTNSCDKYNSSDSLTTLQSEDDAAKNFLGGDWQMPSKEDWNKLFELCDSELTVENGVTGLRLTLASDQEKQLFLPCNGMAQMDEIKFSGSNAYYWSSDLNQNDILAYNVFANEFVENGNNTQERCIGMNVRGIIKI